MSAKRVSLIRLDQERKILKLLRTDPYSLEGISQATGLNYYTARNVVAQLFERGMLTVHSTYERHRFYTYNLDNEEHMDFIPRITDLLNKASIKVVGLLEMVGNESNTGSVKAAIALPKHLTELMIAANSASHGMEVNAQLTSIRTKMQKDYLYIQNMAGYYDQILKEPRFWEPKYLAEMTKDEAFNYQAIQEAQDHYDSI